MPDSSSRHFSLKHIGAIAGESCLIIIGLLLLEVASLGFLLWISLTPRRNAHLPFSPLPQHKEA